MVALSRLSARLSVIGVDDSRRWAILAKCALDGIHSLRRKVLDVSVDTDAELSTATVAGRCAVPQTSTRRHLEELTALGVLERTGEFPERWVVSAWLRERWWATKGEESAHGLV